MIKCIPFALLVLLLTACDAGKNSTIEPSTPGVEVMTMWVNSKKVDCTGVMPMQCMQVQYGKDIDPKGWKNFYDPIEGFTYEEGYVYYLEVEKSERKFPGGQVPADASKFQYKLRKQMSKKAL
jgi:hypothetical protein